MVKGPPNVRRGVDNKAAKVIKPNGVNAVPIRG